MNLSFEPQIHACSYIYLPLDVIQLCCCFVAELKLLLVNALFALCFHAALFCNYTKLDNAFVAFAYIKKANLHPSSIIIVLCLMPILFAIFYAAFYYLLTIYQMLVSYVPTSEAPTLKLEFPSMVFIILIV